MNKLVTLPMLATLALPGIAFSETPPPPPEGACSTYFGVLQGDPNAPGRYVARMTRSQANWYAKNGRKQYPGPCFALEKTRYLIIWAVLKRRSFLRDIEMVTV
jgi:hypothetical protein